MSNRVGDGDSTPLRETKKGDPAEPGSINDSFQITYPSVQRYLTGIPIRQTIAAGVIPDQGIVLSKSKKHVTIERKFPVELKMVQPIG